MAVEARHLNNLFLLPQPQPQLISNRYVTSVPPSHREFFSSKQGSENLYGTMPEMPEAGFPAFYQPAAFNGTLPVKSDSGITTFDNTGMLGRNKRARDSGIDSSACGEAPRKTRALSVLDGDNVALDICRQQAELDRPIDQHTRRMRLELQEKVRQQSKELFAAVHQGTVRRLKAKDDEIRRLGDMNMALQERIKNICIENQLLRSLAQTSEAAANSLRSNLEQVLAHAAAEDRYGVEEDAESCCDGGGGAAGEGGAGSRRACRGCNEKEPCVLLLPCRHLCLCTACGSGVHDCPVCGSVTTGTVHINMS